MHLIRNSALVRRSIYLIIVAIIFPYAAFAQPPVMGETANTVTSCVVLPFENQTGHDDPTLPNRGAAAVALVLEASKEFLVTSTIDLDREMKTLGLSMPMSLLDQVRMGESLRVEKVLTGFVTDLTVNAKNGQARCSIEIRMLDVSAQTVLDGAAATVVTEAIPGWTGDVTKVVDDAMRQASQRAVNEMLGRRVRRGNVDIVTDQGEINTNLGVGDGVEVGTELRVMRPIWSADLEKVVMRPIGMIRLSDVQASLSWGAVVSGGTPQTGDKLYRIYRGPGVQQEARRSASTKKTVQAVAALAILLGIYAIGSGSTSATSSTLSGNLSQPANGTDPTVVLQVDTSNTESERTHGWVIYRAANSAFFPTQPNYMIDVIEGQDLPQNRYSDDPFLTEYVEDFEFTFQYPDADGEAADATVTASWNHLAMVLGGKYYYVVRRIIEPLRDPGYDPPISGEQVTEPVTPALEIDVDSGEGLSEASEHFGPLTFFTYPQLSSPAAGAPSQYVDNITFTWLVSTGADVYRIELFDADQADGSGNPIWVGAEQRATSGQSILSSEFYAEDASSALAYNSQYYWRVGCRASGDAAYPVNRALNQTGWLYSEMRSFRTQISPPSPLGANERPASRTPGFFGSNDRRGAR